MWIWSTISAFASVVTSRGCPFSCTFCDRSTSGRRGRFHGVDYVVAMCRRLERAGVRHILFYDDLFTVNRRRVVELCERFLAEGFRFTWSCNSHPNLLDAATLDVVAEHGAERDDWPDLYERVQAAEIPGSLHVPYDAVQKSLGPGGRLAAEVAEGRHLLFYCSYGERSAMAAEIAREAGVREARSIIGGLEAWLAAGGPVA